MDPVEVVRSWSQGLRAGDVYEHLCHPDVEIVNAEGWVVEATYRGHQGLRRWWHDLDEAFSDFRMEVERITPVDDQRVLTEQRFIGTFRTTGIPFDAPWAAVITVQDGRIRRAVGYVTKRRALRALEAEAG